MTEQADVIVVGGGVIGVCSAYYLAERGVNVTLLERGEICSGASYGNAGLLTPSHSIPLSAPGVLTQGLKWLLDNESPFYIKPRIDIDLMAWLWRFYRACGAKRARAAMPVIFELSNSSIHLFKEIVAAENLECHFEQAGCLHVHTTQKEFEASVEEAELVEQVGVPFKVLDAAELKAFEPAVGDDLAGGVLFPEDAHLEPGAFVHALTAVLERRGVRVVRQCEVRDLHPADSSTTRLETTQGEFRAQTVVVACGALSPTFARRLELNIPIQPAKGYALIVERPENCPKVPLLLKESRIGVTPMGERLRFAGTLELAGLDMSISTHRVEAIRKQAPRYLPQLGSIEPEEIWRGLRPCTPDGLPIIGPTRRHKNVILATGHGMLGVSQATLTGKLVSQLVLGDTPDMDLAPLSIDRFN